MAEEKIELLSVEEMASNGQEPEKKTGEEKKHVPFAVVEAYKRIRTNLTFMLSQSKDNHSIVITSANASEGKSTTSANLAIAFSQLEKRVVVIDADMRRATLHKKFKKTNEQGLSNILSGMAKAEDCLVPINDNLFIITAGDVPPNPSELLGSQNFVELLDYANKNFDLVIVDSPPLNVVTDALIIAPLTVGAVLIVHDGFTPHYSIKKAMEAVEFSNAKLLGVIMNGANSSMKGKYSYRKYKYTKSYSYGYEYRKSPSASKKSN